MNKTTKKEMLTWKNTQIEVGPTDHLDTVQSAKYFYLLFHSLNIYWTDNYYKPKRCVK